MSISQLSGVEQLLSRMREAAQAAGLESAGSTARAVSPPAGGVSFAAELERSLSKVSSMQQSSYQQAQAYEMGEPGISLNNVMVDLQKASLAFQMTVQVRNRLVAAYQEIASMPV
ncbi:MAG: flagellar hook-basal body complex protein FliE [Comamonas sp.]